MSSGRPRAGGGVSARDGQDLAASLSRAVEGEVSVAPEDLDRYSAAACHYAIRPAAVVWPRHAADVEALIAACRATGMPLTARGAGSGVAGHSVGHGVIADFSRHLNRILEVDAARRRVRVQPGVALGALNARLAALGLHFAPDPSSGAYCTIGGMIANNAGGPHSVAYGSTRDHVVELEAVTGEGVGIRAGSAADTEAAATGEGTEAAEVAASARIARELEVVCAPHAETIAERSMRTRRNSSGYDLSGALASGKSNLARLLTGSEGTLAVVTAATLRLQPVPAARAAALAFFDSLERAGEGVIEALEERPCAAELVSETLLRLLRGGGGPLHAVVPAGARAMLLLECDGASEAEALAQLDRIRARLLPRCASAVTVVADPARRAELWAVRAAATLTLSAHEGERRNMRFIEDACVPPQRLVDFIEGVGALVGAEGIETAIFGHAGDSLIHVNPLMDPADPMFFGRIEALAAAFTELVIRCEGTLTGEHGDGRLRTPFLPQRFGPLYPLFAEVKALFDPDGILNPGIIVGEAGGETRVTAGMRCGKTPWVPPEPRVPPVPDPVS